MFKNTIFICCFILAAITISCQNHSKYNLDFRSGDIDNLQWKFYMKPCAVIDSSEIVNEKFPLCIKQCLPDTSSNFPLSEPLVVYWNQNFLIPSKYASGKREGIIEINNKCSNIAELYLVLFGFDKSENIVWADSISINNDSCWTKSSLVFPLKNTHKICVGLNGLGFGNHLFKQEIWLDRIIISIGGKNIEQLACKPALNKQPLDKKALIPLSFDNDSGFDNIPALKDKKIIGLGESIHGSKTIMQSQIQIIKYMIEKQNCKLVLFEADMYAFLYYNLFAQGKLPENEFQRIKDELSVSFWSWTDFADFLLWLREYNLQNEDKVRIAGIADFNYYRWNYSLSDYLYAFYNEQTAPEIYPILNSIHNNLVKALENANNSSRLKEILGEEEFQEFLYALKTALYWSRAFDSLLLEVFQEAFITRDYTMWLNADRYISRLKEDEKAVIVAHDGHINRKITSFPYVYSMGLFIDGKYSENYSPIGIYVGNGTICSREFGDKGLRVVHLEEPPTGSIEAKGLEVQTPYFYYSSDFLNNGDFYYREIGNGYFRPHTYENGPLKEKIDGFIFIAQTQTETGDLIRRTEDDDYSTSLIWDKMNRHNAMMKEIEKNNNRK